MYSVKFDIVGTAPIVFGRYVDDDELPKLRGMKSCDVLNKNCYLKANTDDNGNVVTNPFSIKNMLVTAAGKSGDKCEWNKKAGMMGVFLTGFECPEPPIITVNGKKIKAKNLDVWAAFIPSSPGANNMQAGGKRVLKRFPIIKKNWVMKNVRLIVEDDRILPEKIEEYLILGGRFVGLGSFRKERGGIWGKFVIKNFSKGK